jgi:hypothetical protein
VPWLPSKGGVHEGVTIAVPQTVGFPHRAHRGFHLSLEVFGQIAHNVFDLVVATALHRVPAAEHRVDGRPQCLRAMLRTSKYRTSIVAHQSLNTS